MTSSNTCRSVNKVQEEGEGEEEEAGEEAVLSGEVGRPQALARKPQLAPSSR